MSFSADPSCPGWGWCQHETELVFRGEITLSPITSLLQWAANTYFCLQYGTCHCRGTMSPPFPKFYYSIMSLYAPRYLIEPLFSVPSTVQVSERFASPTIGAGLNVYKVWWIYMYIYICTRVILKYIEFRLEGTFKGHLVQPLCHEQGHLQLDQVA